MSFSAVKFFRGDISCTSGHRGPAPAPPPPPQHLMLFLCLFILPALSPAGLPATEGAQHIFRYNSTMHRWRRLLFKYAGNTNFCSDGNGKQKHRMQPNFSLSCFFFFFSFFFFIFSIFFFFLWKRWKDTFILVSNEVCGVGVWAYAHLHASVPECVPCVCECEDVNVACCMIIIAFLTTHVQLLSWPAGVTV